MTKINNEQLVQMENNRKLKEMKLNNENKKSK